MIELLVTDRDGVRHSVPAEPGMSVMIAMRDNDLPVLAACGGFCACATCHVYIQGRWSAQLPEAEEDELELLAESLHYKEGRSRLSCQIRLTEGLDGLAVKLAPED
jgi:2Fe-2S ferredoxin